jgi:hypothetical protein
LAPEELLLLKYCVYFPQESEVPGASGRSLVAVALGKRAVVVVVALLTAGQVNGVVVA